MRFQTKVRLFGKGLDIIEVSDDGSGVPKSSRDKLAVPYATSKIEQFDDIYRNHSLGFRGEALYSLANVSQKLIVATRTSEEPMAQKLEFRHDGTLDADASGSEMPRKVGTTVAVVKLLDQLPVRRRDLEQRIAAHRSKLVQLITAYAIFRTGVRIHLMDVDVKTGKEKTLVASSFQNSTLSHTISSVLGPKFLAGMTQFSVDLSSIYNDDTSSTWKVEGLISSASGESITKAGQQLYAIHQRPIEFPKLTRILKSSFQLYQDRTPSIILNFIIPHNAYDINVSPDKRTVFFNHEEMMLEKIQLAAAEVWAGDGTFQPRRRYAFVHDPARAIIKEEEEDAKRSQFEQQDTTPDTKLAANEISTKPVNAGEPVATLPQRIMESTLSSNGSFASTWKEKQKWRKAQVQFNKPDSEDEDPLSSTPVLKKPSKRVFGLERFGFTATPVSRLTPAQDIPKEQQTMPDDLIDQSRISNISNDTTVNQATSEESNIATRRGRVGKRTRSQCDDASEECETQAVTPFSLESPASLPPPLLQRHRSSIYSPRRLGTSDESPLGTDDGNRSVLKQPSVPHFPASQISGSSQHQKSKTDRTTECTWAHFGTTEDVISSYRSERAAISSMKGRLKDQLSQNDLGQHTSIKLRKEEFQNMEIIGQFNLGFILAKDETSNLWIFDQHACDEKYNFEKLCLETTIHEQTLMKPLPVELSSLQEACIHDNLDIFQKNGFRFEYNESKPPGKRYSLTALPHSGAQPGRNAVQYGKGDVEALCALLLGEEVDGGTGTDGNGVYGNNAIRRYASSSQQFQVDNIIARLPKTIAMFASRACRTAIMIGRALSEKQMETLVHRLSAIDQPWNCPHGRPTLQHVRLLSSIFVNDEKQQESLIAEPTVTVLSQEEAL